MFIIKMNDNIKNEKNFIEKIYNNNYIDIINYENNKKYHIVNNIKFNENYFNIDNITLKNLKKIYNFLYENYKIEIITIYSYINNLSLFKKETLNKYNYEIIINYYFNLIFNYDLFKLIELFYFHLIENKINL